ncbi:MAG: transketolase [Bacteroidetes bacterium]|nr:transketolase [Bacteroidota bacterium]
MRREFSNIIEQLALEDDKIIFLTGDLGFNAFENLQEMLGDRFINMGVAEQNMISVAAGMASKGFKVFCYSIAPFAVYRPLEQIRNDVCFHKLPVFIVGNGGGYGYGIMGSSHHALEDIATLAGLPDMTCYVPALKKDVESIVKKILENKKPAYLRLGLGLEIKDETEVVNDFQRINKAENPKVTIAVLGPIVENVVTDKRFNSIKNNIDVFAITEIPYTKLSEDFVSSVKNSQKLLVIEEHKKHGGLAHHLSLDILENKILTDEFLSLHAKGYPSNTYGNQKFHQKESGLDSESIYEIINSWI